MLSPTTLVVSEAEPESDELDCVLLVDSAEGLDVWSTFKLNNAVVGLVDIRLTSGDAACEESWGDR